MSRYGTPIPCLGMVTPYHINVGSYHSSTVMLLFIAVLNTGSPHPRNWWYDSVRASISRKSRLEGIHRIWQEYLTYRLFYLPYSTHRPHSLLKFSRMPQVWNDSIMFTYTSLHFGQHRFYHFSQCGTVTLLHNNKKKREGRSRNSKYSNDESCSSKSKVTSNSKYYY